ncbi:MAG: nucleotide exchange factor GrpE [Elusimicrobiota bacterium]
MTKEEAKSDSPEPAAGTPPAGAGAPGEAAKKEEEEKKNLFDQIVRLRAEFENYRKRVDREKRELVLYGKRELLERLIPLHDVLLAAHEHVLRHAGAGLPKAKGGASSDAPQAELVRGLELIFAEFTKLFEAEGVTVIKTVGVPCDFDKHEVLGQVETDEYPEGTVVEELQRGYLLGGRTLRAARVRIAKAGTGKK